MTSLVSSTTLDALRLALIIGVMSEVSQNDALSYTDVDFFFLLNIFNTQRPSNILKTLNLLDF